MDIQDMIRESGLTKKAVYYYIDEGIISPARNENNGYYIFCEEDLRVLKSVRILRDLKLPVPVIKQMLINPMLTPYYLHHHLDNQKRQLKEMLESTQKIQQVVNAIVPRMDRGYLYDFLEKCDQIAVSSEWNRLSLATPEREAEIIAILVWRFFMEVENTEYRSYLWKKIVDETDKQLKTKLIILKWYLRLLNPSDIEIESAYSYKRANAIAEAKPDKLDQFVAEIIEVCQKLVTNKKLQEYWKLEYEPIIIPLLDFTSGPTGRLMSEYNPKYISYFSNIHRSCLIARKQLMEGEHRGLYEQLLRELDNKFDLDFYGGAMLGFLYMYEDSLYTKLPLYHLRQLIEKNYAYPEDVK